MYKTESLITITHNREQFQWNVSNDTCLDPQLQGNYIMTLNKTSNRLISIAILNLEILINGNCTVCHSMSKLNVKMVCGKCIDSIGQVTKNEWGYESHEFVMIDNPFQHVFRKVVCDIRTLWWPLLVGCGPVRKCLVCTRDVYGDIDIDCNRLLREAFFRDYTYIFWLMTQMEYINDILVSIIRSFINPYGNYYLTIPNGEYPLTQEMAPYL